MESGQGSNVMERQLSSRRREALRLDLEDQQKALVDEVYRLTRGLITTTRAPEGMGGDEVLEGARCVRALTPAQARQLEQQVQRLRAVSRALARVSRPEFGICDLCGLQIPFALLAEDATRTTCDGRCSEARQAGHGRG